MPGMLPAHDCLRRRGLLLLEQPVRALPSLLALLMENESSGRKWCRSSDASWLRCRCLCRRILRRGMDPKPGMWGRKCKHGLRREGEEGNTREGPADEH